MKDVYFVIVIVLGWISVWGLSDLLVHNWDKRSKFILYSTMLTGVIISVYLFPKIIQRI